RGQPGTLASSGPVRQPARRGSQASANPPYTSDNFSVRPIYVTGHRNPDTDSIASAIGYAELKGRLDPRNEYLPVRLGDCNRQTRWLLQRSEAPEPRHPPHILLR